MLWERTNVLEGTGDKYRGFTTLWALSPGHLLVLIYLISDNYCYHPHFTDKENEARQVKFKLT